VENNQTKTHPQKGTQEMKAKIEIPRGWHDVTFVRDPIRPGDAKVYCEIWKLDEKGDNWLFQSCSKTYIRRKAKRK